MLKSLWRTHSCVPRSHSCERAEMTQKCRYRLCLSSGVHPEIVHTSVNAARVGACATNVDGITASTGRSIAEQGLFSVGV
jgi:hypothetical protein